MVRCFFVFFLIIFICLMFFFFVFLVAMQRTHKSGAQLHKLLVSGSAATTTTASATNTDLARLPGGAELNILSTGTNGTTTAGVYRNNNGKLAIVNNGFAFKGMRKYDF